MTSDLSFQATTAYSLRAPPSFLYQRTNAQEPKAAQATCFLIPMSRAEQIRPSHKTWWFEKSFTSFLVADMRISFPCKA